MIIREEFGVQSHFEELYRNILGTEFQYLITNNVLYYDVKNHVFTCKNVLLQHKSDSAQQHKMHDCIFGFSAFPFGYNKIINDDIEGLHIMSLPLNFETLGYNGFVDLGEPFSINHVKVYCIRRERKWDEGLKVNYFGKDNNLENVCDYYAITTHVILEDINNRQIVFSSSRGFVEIHLFPSNFEKTFENSYFNLSEIDIEASDNLYSLFSKYADEEIEKKRITDIRKYSLIFEFK